MRAGLNAAIASDHPTYLRIGKKREPVIHSGRIVDFEIGKAIPIREGDDAAILVSGNLLPAANEAVDQLAEHGFQPSLYSLPTIEPLDHSLLRRLFDTGKPIYAIEEHNRNGGLGTAILEWANENQRDARQLVRLAAPNAFLHRTANQSEAREILQLTASAFATRILAETS